MHIPTATYRLQFCPDFGFTEAQSIIPYLAQLGVSDIYASPIFQARKGSQHGYDIVDANSLNSELGTVEQFHSLMTEIDSFGLGWLQDIVPNHRAYDDDNPTLIDVLEHGENSAYAQYFDINWHHPYPELQGRVLTPLLGDFYGNCLENGELQLVYDQQGLSITYYELKIPLRIESYPNFLTYNLGNLTRELGRKHPDILKLLGILYLIKNLTNENISYQQRQDQVNFIKSLIWEIYQQNSLFEKLVQDNLVFFNGEVGKPETFEPLDKILTEQFFRLAYWKVGAEELNYRRFFTVNELICLRVEDFPIFAKTHQLIAELVKSNKFTGLRIDHIDGLHDPTVYLQRLKELVGNIYIVVEKILEIDEVLPKNWSTEGTSGYDFLNQVNGVFCRQENAQKFDQIYHKFTGKSNNYEQLVVESKLLIAETNLVGDIDNLAHLFKEISNKYYYGRDFTLSGLRKAILEILVQFQVYRTYINQAGISQSDRQYLTAAIAKAKQASQRLIKELSLIEQIVLQTYDASVSETDKQQWLEFTMKLQQYTGPLMAKGIEDTLFYVYNRLVSLNEVGGNPQSFGVAVAEFHQFNWQRLASHPYSMNATSTHDTKRSEDVRARLNVLSEIPSEWEEIVASWRELNQNKKISFNSQSIPDANDEYFFYQNLLGVYPFQLEDRDNLISRLKNYSIKAVREAKIHTAWLRPDQVYEDGLNRFIERVFDLAENQEFWQSFAEFKTKIAFYGVLNSLSQTLLKITCPGIPDFYQGTELWDFSLVDPDNRRPVNYSQRHEFLEGMDAAKLEELKSNYSDGRLKLWLTQRALQIRNKYKQLYLQGEYLPLEVEGKWANHVIAFARRQSGKALITIVGRHFTSLHAASVYPVGEAIWGDTCVNIPPNWSKIWQDTLSDQKISNSSQLGIGQIFTTLPIALLESE